MNRTPLLLISPACLLLTLNACRGVAPSTMTAPLMSSTVHATNLTSAPTLGDPRWDQIPAHALTLNAKQIAEGQHIHEPGSFRLAYDDHAIYLRIDFTDHDVVTTATADFDKLYTAGDVAEWFIGTPPADDGSPGTYYELHIAPNGLRSAYRIDRPGLIEEVHPLPFTSEVNVHGSLNNPTDRETGWSALFTLPWDALAQLTPSLARNDGPPSNLSLLVSRYNYGHHLPYNPQGQAGPELSMWPTQPQTNYHMRTFHARVAFK